MPTDLDDLFDALGRQADAVPLAGADHARRRGRRRTRIRAAVSVAAAVVLVAAGIGAAQRQPDHRAAPPAAVPVDGDPMPEIGSPIDLGGPISYSVTAHDDNRVYVASIREQDNSAWLIAADVRTGARAWPAQRIDDPDRSIDQVVVAPGAVLVVTRSHNGSVPAVGLFAFDPATGTPLWQNDAVEGDSLVFSDRALIRVQVTGSTEGFDWVTGEPRWSLTLDHDKPVRGLGMTRPADEERVSRSGPASTFTDGSFVLVTWSGVAQVREAATGRLQRTVPVGAKFGDTMVAYDGWLFTHDEPDGDAGPQRVRATDLTGDGGSAVVQTVPGRLLTIGGCGPDRVCVVTEGESTVLTAVDVRKRQQVWRATSQYGGETISSAHGRTLLSSGLGGYEFFDAAGHLLFRSNLVGGWLDADTLLVIAPDGTGRLSRWTAANRRLHPLASPPGETAGTCTSSSDWLACVTPGGLRIWKVS